MSEEYYEDMLEQVAINKYLNMIANDYNGELAKIFEEKYIKKDKEIERLNNIINKAIEYIESNPLVFYGEEDIYVNDIIAQEKNISNVEFIKKLLDILKGADKE